MKSFAGDDSEDHANYYDSETSRGHEMITELLEILRLGNLLPGTYNSYAQLLLCEHLNSLRKLREHSLDGPQSSSGAHVSSFHDLSMLEVFIARKSGGGTTICTLDLDT